MKRVDEQRAAPGTPAAPGRGICTLMVAGRSMPVTIRAITAREAELQSAEHLPLGQPVELLHPQGGRTAGLVSAVTSGGIKVSFPLDTRSVAFALAVLAASACRDQSRAHSLRG